MKTFKSPTIKGIIVAIGFLTFEEAKSYSIFWYHGKAHVTGVQGNYKIILYNK